MRFVCSAVTVWLLVIGAKAPLLMEQSIVMLQMPNDEGVMKAVCSGVVVQTVPVPFIFTEAHCIDGADITTMRVEGNALVEVARNHDVVLLRVQGWLVKHVPARMAEKDPEIGSRVRAAGWAFGRFVAVTVGHISGEYDGELYFDIECIRGMSGGPIVNDDGKVVSLVRAFVTDGSPSESSPNGLTVGASTRYLRDLLTVVWGMNLR